MSAMLYPERNLLLGGLSAAEQHRLYPCLELVELIPGAVLYEPYEPMRYAYFPLTSILSVLCRLKNGDSLEFAVTGNDGFFDIALLLGGQSAPRLAIVHSGGQACRLEAHVLKAEFARCGNMHDLFLRYVQAVVTQASQTVVCNRHHVVQQQLCRWLLTFLDRLGTNRVNMTHQRIAGMLGVRRESVTLAARNLQQLGVICYHRGEISVLDRPRLESLSCECYRVVTRERERLLQHYRLPATGTA